MSQQLRGGSLWSEQWGTRSTFHSRNSSMNLRVDRVGFRIASRRDRSQAIRGGSFLHYKELMRCANRDWYLLDLRDSDFDFRVARRKS